MNYLQSEARRKEILMRASGQENQKKEGNGKKDPNLWEKR